MLELLLTTFNKELYEQGLKEEGAREADQRVAEYSGLLYTTCPEFGNHHSGVWVPLIPA